MQPFVLTVVAANYVSAIPYRRNYGRLVIAVSVVATCLFPLIPVGGSTATEFVRALTGTFGMSIALLLAPAFIYAGLRTKCPGDVVAGSLGMLTLLYWVPKIVMS